MITSQFNTALKPPGRREAVRMLETLAALFGLILKALELLERLYDMRAKRKALNGKHSSKPR